ncbi:unnamed protein product [Rotaria socialis]|uniref:Protein kinase domain-containing protein n=1 Tax=Rotaria socialis TaxID=392032 RepID=A0A817KY38_9BILA|nr:unnamed protein product [Rotaria socialis]CAF3432191.1 unnamed protein product [Rotaria socialis]CAF3512272.1 unnamed protein product [Rotaria socialis]CAF3539541.1 unnamed protein product [Rotaria socialis]CAF4154851.1 unnamed protein product [Rotaria socialis]
MASNDSTFAEWLWQSNINPYSTTEKEEWCSYTEEECSIIEEAYVNGDNHVVLKNHYIDFAKALQISIQNPTRRRPVKRVVHNKELWIKKQGKLGEGAFGKVYKGTYRGYQEVAYKVTKTHLSEAAQCETNILKTLHHPNIVQYIDVIHTSTHTLLVMELIDGGTLFNYITNTRKSTSYWSTSRNVMTDVAYAMSYLHEKNVVHADLKSDNILLRNNGTAVLSDFGLSKIIEDSSFYQNDSHTGAIRWLAPELCFNHPERSSFQSDVWAFGCVLLEIMTKKLPWQDKYEKNTTLMNALANERNGSIFQEICREQEAPEKFRRILCACCTWPKRNRPTFEKIIKDFRSISNSDLDNHNERQATSNSSSMFRSSHHADDENHWRTMSAKTAGKRQDKFAKKALYSSDDDDDDSSSARTQTNYIHTPWAKARGALKWSPFSDE